MIDAATHRKLAVALFNRTWELIEVPQRSLAEDEEMLYSAHASRFHWGAMGGTGQNLAIGEWQIARVYALLGRAEAAIHHGRRSLEHCGAHQLAPFYFGFAHEAIARGLGIVGNGPDKAAHAAEAARYLEQLTDEEEIAFLSRDLATL